MTVGQAWPEKFQFMWKCPNVGGKYSSFNFGGKFKFQNLSFKKSLSVVCDCGKITFLGLVYAFQHMRKSLNMQYCEWGLFFLKMSVFKWKKNKNGKIVPKKENILLQFLPSANLSAAHNSTVDSYPHHLWKKKPEFAINTLQLEKQTLPWFDFELVNIAVGTIFIGSKNMLDIVYDE